MSMRLEKGFAAAVVDKLACPCCSAQANSFTDLYFHSYDELPDVLASKEKLKWMRW